METRALEGGLPKCGKKWQNFTSETFSKIWSRCHFTREIALNDEHLIQLFPNRKVLADNCFYYHSWRNNVVIYFGTLSSFLT